MTDAMPKPRLIDKMVGVSPTERYKDSQLEAVHQVLNRITTKLENQELDGGPSTIAEGLGRVEMMIDAKGWTSVFEYGEDAGLTLRQVKDASEQIRELLVGNPFVKNGSRLRNVAVWGGGVEFSARNRTGRQEPKTLPGALQTLMEDPRNWRYVFSNDAHEEMERAVFSDGNFFLLGDDSSKKMQRVQLHEIHGDLRNPNNTEEIWAYRRKWVQNPNEVDPGKRKEMVRWYYTDIYDGTRKASIRFAEKTETVERGYTMLDKTVNRQVGWAYGVPDALAIIAWARLYTEFLTNGYIMSRALARFAYKVTAASNTAGTKAAAEVVLPGQSGATAVQGTGNDLQAMTNAGKGYDFASGKAIAAAMAAGLEVSLLSLLSDPSSATGSSAAAQTLDAPQRATAVMRRRSWDDYFVRIFRWMGLTQRLVTTWPELPEDTLQRIMQAWTLVDGLEVYGPEVIQSNVSKVLKIADPGKVPDGWKPRSQRTKVDPESTAGGAGSTDGSGQGDDDGSGDSQDDHDDDE